MSARSDQPRRRSFTAEYEAAILAGYGSLTVPGAKAALLRREGVYSSHIVDGAVPAMRVLRLGCRTTRLT